MRQRGGNQGLLGSFLSPNGRGGRGRGFPGGNGNWGAIGAALGSAGGGRGGRQPGPNPNGQALNSYMQNPGRGPQAQNRGPGTASWQPNLPGAGSGYSQWGNQGGAAQARGRGDPNPNSGNYNFTGPNPRGPVFNGDPYANPYPTGTIGNNDGQNNRSYVDQLNDRWSEMTDGGKNLPSTYGSQRGEFVTQWGGNGDTSFADEANYIREEFGRLGITPPAGFPGSEKGSGQVPKRFKEGTAEYYDDSYGAIRDYLNTNAGINDDSPGGIYRTILNNFKGNPEDLQEFLKNSGPFVAASLQGSKSFQEATRLDYDDPMQALGGVQGSIAGAATQGNQVGQRSLTQQGLGRSSARAGLAAQTQQQAGGQMGNAYQGLYQQRNDQRRRAATSAFDQQRLVASMALGMNPAPRVEMPRNDGKDQLYSGAGALIGTGLLGPGLGTVVGGAVGGAVS